MNNKKFTTLLLVVIITAASVLVASTNIAPAQSSTLCAVSGHVYDNNGYAAPRAYTYLIDSSSGRSAGNCYSDSSGFYYITVPAGTYALVSSLIGSTLSYSQRNIVISSDTTKDINLVVGYKVSGRVLDSSGHIVAGALTNVYNSDWVVPGANSDASGYYAIYAPAGTYSFVLWPPLNTHLINYQNDSFTITSDMTYDIVMSSGNKVSGYVQCPSGQKVSGVTTYLVNSTGYTFTSGRYSDAMWSAGSYSIVAPAGNYTLLAKLNSVQCYYEPNVEVNGDIAKNVTLITVALSPSTTIMDVGQSYPYTAAATGGSGTYTTYVWYANGIAQGATSTSTFNFTPAQVGTYQITAVAKDSSGSFSTQSTTVFATVNSALLVPDLSVSTSFLDQGQLCLLSGAEASGGTGPYSYQWYSKAPNANVYTLIEDATSLSYSFDTSTSTAIGTWYFVLNATDCASNPNTVSSKAASVQVNAPPSVTVTPDSVVLDVGSTKTFTASVSGGSGSLTYAWYLDGVRVGGNNTSFPYVAASGTHSLYVKVTDSAAPPISVSSNTVSITTNPPLLVPTAIAINSAVDQGQTVKLNSTATVNGTPPYSYQWYAKEPGGNFKAILGATSPNCSVALSSNITVGSWKFVLNVTDSATVPVTVTTNQVEVTVNAAPSVTISPATAAITVGQSSLFTANATAGSGSYTSYQWYVNGAQQGQNASTFSFSPTSAGSYSVSVTVTDSFGATSNMSAAASIQVSPAPTPTPSPSTPSSTVKPTTTPTPSSTPTNAPTENPTVSPSPTATDNVTQGPDNGTLVLVSIVAVIAAAVVIGVFFVAKTKKPK